MSRITDAVQRITALAPTPEMLPLLTRLLRDPTSDLEEIATVARHDMDLAASLLKRCNSATRRGAEPVESVDEAILRLGLQSVLEIVMTLLSQRLYALPPEAQTHLRGLWDHALLTGILARDIVQNTELSRPMAFTAGLLHDIGKVFLIKAGPTEYVQTLQRAQRHHRACADQEEEDFGTHHGTVGGEMLSRWKLPASIVTGVWFHHHTDLVGEQSALARAIEMADALTYVAGYGLADYYSRFPNALRNLEEFHFKPIDVTELLANGLREAEQVRQLLGSGN